ncbi:MAG: DNA-binding protein [Spirosoma sp.]|nr:DNA-binding protein [Spirosoma sp.]
MATNTTQDHLSQDDKDLQQEFHKLINMSASELKKWLSTDESKSMGQKKEGAEESIGHQSGEQIVGLLDQKKKGVSEDDLHQMKRVVSYIKRHLAQRPADVVGSNWEYSLKNWGHDPTRK